MNPLLDNPIGNMRGPAFLAFFALIAAACIAWAYRRALAADPTQHQAVPKLPTEFDPFELAFLRGGTHELARLIIFDLITRGYLERRDVKGVLGITSTQKIGIAPRHPTTEYLHPNERIVFNWMRDGKEPQDIFPGLSSRLDEDPESVKFRAELEARDLLTSAARRSKIWESIHPPLFVIGGLAGYKLIAATASGHHNILFLLILAVLAVVILMVTARPKRLTAMGRKYFAQVQESLTLLKDRVGALVSGKSYDHLVLAVAAFGISVLEGTSYGYYPEMFKKAATQAGGGCGSGCGSSSGSSCGGGCGGGCGGCGG